MAHPSREHLKPDKFINVSTVTNKNGDLVVINRNGKLIIVEDTPLKKSKKGNQELIPAREKERYALVYGSTLKVHDGQHVDAGQPLVEWDPFTSAIATSTWRRKNPHRHHPRGAAAPRG